MLAQHITKMNFNEYQATVDSLGMQGGELELLPGEQLGERERK